MGISDEQEQPIPNVPPQYASGVQFKVGVYDFQMDFIIHTDPRVPPVVVASVHMSPQLAKVFGRLLRKNVKAFEQRIGPISLPEELLTQLDIVDETE